MLIILNYSEELKSKDLAKLILCYQNQHYPVTKTSQGHTHTHTKFLKNPDAKILKKMLAN